MTSWVSVAAASRDLRREEGVGTDADRGSSLEGKGPEHEHYLSSPPKVVLRSISCSRTQSGRIPLWAWIKRHGFNNPSGGFMAQEKPVNDKVEFRVQLIPMDNPDQPVVANYTSILVTPGIAYLDFGFIEPKALDTLAKTLATQDKNKEMPKGVRGRLAVRVALGFDALAQLHRQLEQTIKGIRPATSDKPEGRRG